MRLRPLALAAVLAACGGGGSTPPPPPSPPAVTVIPSQSYVVDSELDVNVTVSGCDAVQSVQLADGQRLLGTAAAPDTQNTFHVGRTAIDYQADGVPAHLALVATATCANGASSLSPSANVTFLPADQVFAGTFTLPQLTLDTTSQSLVACQGTNLALYDFLGTALETTQLEFPCTSRGYGLRAGPNELYWVEPGYGVARINPEGPTGGTLDVLSQTQWNPGPAFFPAGGANPAVFFDASGNQMLWLDRSTGQVLASGVPLAGPVDGDPGLGSAGLFVPEAHEELSGTQVDLQVERFDVGTAASTGATVLAYTPVGSLGTANIPALNLSPSGGVGYFVAGDTHQDVYACDTTRTCDPTSGGLIYKVTLPGGPWSVAEPVGNTLSVRGGGAVQFLDSSGTPLGAATTATGALQVQGVYPGANNQLYVVNADGAGNPLELVMLQAPGQEGARLTLNTGTLAWDLGQDGKPYVIFDSKLRRLLSPDQYLQVRQ